MKKIVFLVLSIVLASMLIVSGCSQQSSNQAEVTPSLLDKQETIGEIKFSIPSEWRKIEKEDDIGAYYYPYEDNYTLLAVQVFSTSEFPSYDISDKAEITGIIDDVINGLANSSDSYNEVSKDVKAFSDGIYYSIVDYESVMNGKEYEILACIFLTPTNTYSVMFGQPSEISNSFRDLYHEIIESIVIISNEEEPEVATAEPTNFDQIAETTTSKKKTGTTTSEQGKSKSTIEPSIAPTSIPESTLASTPIPTSATSVTTGEQNALKKAKSYLSYSAFSYEGLVSQLEYEGFTHKEAVYGVDKCGANWNEQALKKAKSYLSYSAFSYEGLVSQLEYEGFTNNQAVYGVDRCGANWNEQAAKKAESYIKYSSFSREGLIQQLEYEGFTHAQAVYGTEAVGY